MEITNIEFNEIIPGMYISDDGKGLVIEMFDLTELDKNVDFSELSAEVALKIQEWAQEYAEKIEGIVFDRNIFY
jgi:hypothetical protein